MKAGQKWQIVGFGTIMGQTVMPDAAMGWLDPTRASASKGYILGGIQAAQGRPAVQLRQLGRLSGRARAVPERGAGAGANLVVISGDSHNGWAYDLGRTASRAGVEFAGHSVTSNGYESVDQDRSQGRRRRPGRGQSRAQMVRHQSRRGYMALTITPTKVSNDWLFVDSIKTRVGECGGRAHRDGDARAERDG